MRLLFDHNLSHKIVPMLADLFDCVHIRDIGLHRETPDNVVWQFARSDGYIIVTTDADFLRLSERYGAPPQIIRLEKMDYGTRMAANLMRRHAVLIREFTQSSRATLVLRNK